MKGAIKMIYSKEVENMCPVAKGVDHGPAPIPEEGKWVKSKDIKLFCKNKSENAGNYLQKNWD